MARKDYPFRQSDLKRGSNLVSGLLAAPFALFVALGSSNRLFDEDLIDHDYRPFKTIRFVITNIIAAIVFFALGCSVLIFNDWWSFLVNFPLLCLEVILITIVTPIIGIHEDLSTYYVFDKYVFLKQVMAIRFILALWSIVFVVHIIIDVISLIHLLDTFFAFSFILFDLTVKLPIMVYFLVVQIKYKKYLSTNESGKSILDENDTVL